VTDALAHFATVHGEATPRLAMARACETMLEASAQARTPIHLAPVWRLLGAQVRTEDMASDGALGAYGGHFVVRVRQHVRRLVSRGGGQRHPSSWRRWRFTVAHELAHLILIRSLPGDLLESLADPDSHAEVERLCDVGAAHLLMPGDAFDQAVLYAGVSPQGLRTMYDEFLVSWSALLVRLSERFEANAALWSPRQRDADGELMRVVQSFGTPNGPLWLPPGLSERYLTEPIVRVALRDASAACRRLESAHAAAPAVLALGARIPTTSRPQEALPLWRGLTVPDEQPQRDLVMTLVLSSRSRTAFNVLRRAEPFDRPRGAAAIPLAMKLAG
jgi:hypothetical protein